MNDLNHRLGGLLIATAEAHHAATGGINPQWADWYATQMLAELNSLLDIEWSQGSLKDWLITADRRYRDEEPPISWPKAYAGWLLEDTGITP